MMMMVLIEESNTNCILWTMYRRQQVYGSNDHGHYWMLQKISQVVFSVNKNHSNSCRYNLCIFVSFFHRPFLFLLDSLFSFFFLASCPYFFQFSFACNVITLTISLSFYVSLKHTTFFFMLSGCAYH